MQYLGGKSRQSVGIESTILACTDSRSVYVEPFLGGANVATRMVKHFDRVLLSDVHPDLVMMWDAAVNGGWVPPDEISKELWLELKNSDSSALRGFAGFACSFGAVWFASYARQKNYNFAKGGANSVARKLPGLRGAEFSCIDYRNVIIPDDAVVYCDPPYVNTDPNGYRGIEDFDINLFWSWATDLADRASVFVSEYSAPAGWFPVAEFKRSVRLNSKHGGERFCTEYLFKKS